MKNVLRASGIKMKVILVLSLVQLVVSDKSPKSADEITGDKENFGARSIDIGQLNSKPPQKNKDDWEKFLAPPYMPAGAKIGNVRQLYNSIIREEKTEAPVEIFDSAPWTPMSGHHGHGHDHGHGHGHDNHKEKNEIKQDARVKKETNIKKNAKPSKPLVKRPAVGPPIPNSKFIRPAISPSAAAPHSAAVSHHPHSAAGSHHPHSAAVSHPHSAGVSHPHSAAVSHPHSAAVSHPHQSTPVKKVQLKKPHGAPPKRAQKPVARQPSVRLARPSPTTRNLKASRPLSKTSKKHLKQSAARQAALVKANQRARSLQQRAQQRVAQKSHGAHHNVDHSGHHGTQHTSQQAARGKINKNARANTKQKNKPAVRTAAKVQARNLPAKTIITSNTNATSRRRVSAGTGKSLEARPHAIPAVRRPSGAPPTKKVRAPISKRRTVPRARSSGSKPAAVAAKPQQSTKYVFNPLSKEDATKFGVGTLLVGSLLAL